MFETETDTMANGEADYAARLHDDQSSRRAWGTSFLTLWDGSCTGRGCSGSVNRGPLHFGHVQFELTSLSLSISRRGVVGEVTTAPTTGGRRQGRP